MNAIFKSINAYNESRLKRRGFTGEPDFEYLKEKLFLVSVEVLLIIGTISYLPSMVLAFLEKQYLVLMIDSFTMLVFLAFFLNNSLKSKVKVQIILLLLYTLGIILIFSNGPYGTGLIYLMGFSVVAATFLDFRMAIYALIVNFCTLTILAVLHVFSPFESPFFAGYTFMRWGVVSINFMAINIIISVSIAYFVRLLKRSLIREDELRLKLKKKSERLIEAKIRAEESDQLKSSFLANVSHEFRTPMNSIMGFTEIMLYTNPDEEKRIRYLNNIHKSSEQLLQIIHNTIEYSKIELGTISLELSSFFIEEMFDSLYEQHLPKAPEGVDYLMVGNSEMLKSKIYTDRNRFFQVFTNLIINAFKFTSKGSVSFGIMESAHDEYYQFFVKDTGIGIRKEKQKDIFTRFHKEDDFKAGTGLGLSISATLIMHMGGRIWLESEPGDGTTFYFILPVVHKKRILE